MNLLSRVWGCGPGFVRGGTRAFGSYVAGPGKVASIALSWLRVAFHIVSPKPYILNPKP